MVGADILRNDMETSEPDLNPDVGVPNGHIDPFGETYVYEYDEDGNFVGWHKEPSAEALAERDGR